MSKLSALSRSNDLISSGTHDLTLGSVPVKVDIYPGLPHAFGYFPSLSASNKNAVDTVEAVKTLVAEAMRKN